MKFTRKPNRLSLKQIYRSDNSFFVTVCTVERKCIFVEDKPLFPANRVEENFNSPKRNNPRNNGQINLSATGLIIKETWLDLTNMFENLVLDEFVIMPNHFHGIITFLDVPVSKFTGKDSDLGKIIKYFKSSTTIKIKQITVEGKLVSPLSSKHNNNGELTLASTQRLIDNYNTIWQKSFYDHVIRGENDLQRIREYITNNLLKWVLDILNPKNAQKYEKWLIAKNNKLSLSFN